MTIFRQHQELRMTIDELTPLLDEQLHQQLVPMRRDYSIVEQWHVGIYYQGVTELLIAVSEGQ